MPHWVVPGTMRWQSLDAGTSVVLGGVPAADTALGAVTAALVLAGVSLGLVRYRLDTTEDRMEEASDGRMRATEKATDEETGVTDGETGTGDEERAVKDGERGPTDRPVQQAATRIAAAPDSDLPRATGETGPATGQETATRETGPATGQETATGETGPATDQDTPASPTSGTVESPAVQPEDEPRSDEQRVLDLLAANDGRMKQGCIVAETDWSDSKVSMLLSEMDDDGTITKLRIGRENLVCLDGEEPDLVSSSSDERGR